MAASMRMLCRRLILQNRAVSLKNTFFFTINPINTKILPSETSILNKKFIFTSSRLCDEEQLDEDEVKTEEKVEKKELTAEDISAAINYIGSEDYLEKYGDKPVWANYRRNFKGGVPPKKTRKTCIRGKGETLKVCGNPCPLCRNEELVLHHTNVKLLEQFVCPHSLEIYSWYRTSVCQRRHKELTKAVETSRALGLMPAPRSTFVKYDYEDYYKNNHSDQLSSMTSS
ncbi:uncharacterized protein LOC117121459 [Anneissia japonica]|uniref:uncharacterized protein LOC117121459 n=1 Tax=Anneissia japonica TaxID=1529436 RepID=UPI0014254E74|nr:uncharacterized protein LOC117121459 [Anneissia japonica]